MGHDVLFQIIFFLKRSIVPIKAEQEIFSASLCFFLEVKSPRRVLLG